MSRRILIGFVALVILLPGCRHREPPRAGLFRKSSWWDRRMARLEMWNLHNGRILDKIENTTVHAIGATLVSAAFVGAAYYYWTHPEQLLDSGDEFPPP